MRLAALAMLIVVVGCDAASEPSTAQPDGPQPATIDQLLGPWSPTPFIAPPGLATAANRACRAMLTVDSRRPIDALELKVLDVRGGGVAQAFLADGNGNAGACNDMTIRGDGSIVANGGGSSSGGQPAGPLGEFEIRVEDTSWSQNGQATSSRAAGPVGPGIVHVAVLRPGMLAVEASISNGWFAAWVPEQWPPGWSVAGFNAGATQVASVPAP